VKAVFPGKNPGKLLAGYLFDRAVGKTPARYSECPAKRWENPDRLA